MLLSPNYQAASNIELIVSLADTNRMAENEGLPIDSHNQETPKLQYQPTNESQTGSTDKAIALNGQISPFLPLPFLPMTLVISLLASSSVLLPRSQS